MATTKQGALLQVGLFACCAVSCVGPGAAGKIDGIVPAVKGAVVWKADASRPLSSQWAELSTQHACGVLTAPGVRSPRISVLDDGTAPSRARRFYRVAILPGDDCFGSRSELGQGNPVKWNNRLFFSGQDRWMSWAVRLAPGFPTCTNAWQTVAQWKQTAAYPGGAGGSPPLEMDVYRCRWRITHTSWDPNDQFDPAKGYRREYFAPAITGRWVRFTMHVVFSANPSRGVFALFGNMGDGRGWRVLLPLEHTATLKRDVGGTWLPIPDHLRLGIYRNPVAYSANTYIDYAGFTVATSRAAAEAGAFG